MRKKVLFVMTCLWVTISALPSSRLLDAAEPAAAVLPASVTPEHPTLYKMLGGLPVKLTAKGGAVYTGKARVTLEATGWVNILFNPIGDVDTNGFAVKLSNYTDLVVVDDEGTLTVSTNEDARLKTWWFDEVSDRLAFRGDITLSYLPSQGLLNISLSSGGLRFTAAMIVETQEMSSVANSVADDECPGGKCDCGDDCSTCCVEGQHAHCDCHALWDKCECLLNNGMIGFMLAQL